MFPRQPRSGGASIGPGSRSAPLEVSRVALLRSLPSPAPSLWRGPRLTQPARRRRPRSGRARLSVPRRQPQPREPTTGSRGRVWAGTSWRRILRPWQSTPSDLLQLRRHDRRGRCEGCGLALLVGRSRRAARVLPGVRHREFASDAPSSIDVTCSPGMRFIDADFYGPLRASWRWLNASRPADSPARGYALTVGARPSDRAAPS